MSDIDAEHLTAELSGLADTVSRAEEAFGHLLDISHGLHPDQVAAAVAAHATVIGLHDLTLYLVDYGQSTLVPMPDHRGADRDPLDVDSTLAGRSFRTQQLITSPGSDEETGVRLWVPLIDGADRLGVMAATATEADDLLRRRSRRLATIAASMVVAKTAYGDGLERIRRRAEMDLAAELRWSMLPPLTYQNDQVAITCMLEPAYEIAGDSFDYAINGDIANVAIIDAMGHGLEASRIANLASIAYQHARRHGATLPEMFQAMDAAVADQFGPERFVTGQLGQLTLSTGRWTWLNAGHPRPLLLRGGTHITELHAQTHLPIGLGDVVGELSEVALEPGDSILFFTDGVVEARSPDGGEFGLPRLQDLLVRAAASDEVPPETLRRLSRAVLDHQSGQLQDDATLLLVRWLGPAASA